MPGLEPMVATVSPRTHETRGASPPGARHSSPSKSSSPGSGCAGAGGVFYHSARAEGVRLALDILDKNGKPLYAGTVRVNPSAKPWAIDFEHTEEALKGKTWKGIYVLDGDTLTICDNAPNLDEGRPVSFETKSGSGFELITFKRAAPNRA